MGWECAACTPACTHVAAARPPPWRPRRLAARSRRFWLCLASHMASRRFLAPPKGEPYCIPRLLSSVLLAPPPERAPCAALLPLSSIAAPAPTVLASWDRRPRAASMHSVPFLSIHPPRAVKTGCFRITPPLFSPKQDRFKPSSQQPSCPVADPAYGPCLRPRLAPARPPMPSLLPMEQPAQPMEAAAGAGEPAADQYCQVPNCTAVGEPNEAKYYRWARHTLYLLQPGSTGAGGRACAVAPQGSL